MAASALTASDAHGSDGITQWITQRLDHFERSNPATYQQRYLINATFFDGTGPVFLCVGGEGPGFTTDVVVTGTEHAADMIEAAEMHGALILALEHRYYGQSIPTADLSTENLKWLSSQQALGDLAVFVGMINEKHKLSPAKGNKWVTWGGSYPGMMASFARLKFPQLIHGAVASSAPVEAILNMQGYMDVSAASLGATSVGGSAECAKAVEVAFASIGELLQEGPAGWAGLVEEFSVCGGTHALDEPLARMTLAEDLSFSFPIQSNDPGCTTKGCNISSICNDFMTDPSIGNEMARLRAFNQLLNKQQGTNCTAVSYEASTVAPLTNITNAGGGDRVWTWQTCTEYGFYQTCDPGSGCIFTSTPHSNNLASYLAQCSLAFGDAFNPACGNLTGACCPTVDGVYLDCCSAPMQPNAAEGNVQESIDFSNLWDGGGTPGSSRVLYVNGEIDPWHSQSVLPDNTAFGQIVHVGAVDSGLSALMVQGSSHHYWTHADGVQSPAIVQARQLIFAQVGSWLKED